MALHCVFVNKSYNGFEEIETVFVPYLEFLRFSKSVENKNCNNRRHKEQDSDQNGGHQLQLKLGAETKFETLNIF